MLLFCERKSALKNEWERGRRGRKKEQEVEREKKRKKQRFSSINLRFFCLLYANSSFWILSSRIISSVASFSLSSNAPSVVMGSSSSRVDFELWQNKISFFKVFRKIEEILSNRFESSKMKKKKNRIKEHRVDYFYYYKYFANNYTKSTIFWILFLHNCVIFTILLLR